MEKKSRTGLQSKVSHIFAGVPIPRKKKPYSEQPESETKPDTTEISQELENLSVVEESVDQQEIVLPGQDEESSVSQEPQIEQTQEKESQSEEFVIDEAVGEQEQDFISYETDEDVSQDEEFAVVASADDEADISEKVKEEPEAESELSDVTDENESSLDFLMSPQLSSPGPESEESSVQEVSDKKKEVEKSSVEQPVITPPVKEPVVENPDDQKLKIDDIKVSPGDKKLLSLERTKVQTVTKRDLKSSRKAASKSKRKSAKIKPQTSRSKQKTMVMLVVFLSVLLVVIIGKQSGFVGSSSTSSSGTINIPQSSTISAGKVSKATIVWNELPVYPEDIRDPMKLDVEEIRVIPNKKTEFVVTVISIVDGQYLATIDGERKRTGDMVGDAEIINITGDSVEFERNGEVWTQTIGQE